MKKTLTLAAAFALLFGAGCCDSSPRRAAGVRGVVANSTAVALVASSSGRGWIARGCAPCVPCIPCGGAAATLPGGGCSPPPPLPAAAAPESVVPGGGCPASPFDGVVCAPADNLGECFTLPEQEVRPEVEIFVPNGGVLEKLSDIPQRDDPYQAAVNRSVDGGDEETVPAPAVPSTAEAETETGTEAEAKTEETGTDDAEVVTAARPDPVAPADPTDDAELSAALPSPAADEEMPPVFRDGMTDGAAEEVLSRSAQPAAAGGLPRVELPPELD